MKKLTGFVTMIAVLIFSMSAIAQTKTTKTVAPTEGTKIISTMGGAIVPLNTRMLDLGTGFPSAIFVRYHIPIAKKFEVAPFFTFDYGYDTVIAVGNILGLQLKYSLYNSPKFKLSLAAEPGLRLAYYPGGFGLGIQLGLPEVLMTIPIDQKFAIDAGFKIPIAFLAYPGFLVSIPILFNTGIEYNLMRRMNLIFNIDLGPDILARGGFSLVRFRADVLLGISYRF